MINELHSGCSKGPSATAVARVATYEPAHVRAHLASYRAARRTYFEALKCACEAAAEVDSHVILVLDNISGIAFEASNSLKYDWMPDWRAAVIGDDPDHWLHRLRIVVTVNTSDTDDASAVSFLKTRCQGRKFVETRLPRLSRDESSKFVHSYCMQCNMTRSDLTTKEIDEHLKGKASYGNPRYLRLVLDELHRKQYEGGLSGGGQFLTRKLPHTIKGLVQVLIESMEEAWD